MGKLWVIIKKIFSVSLVFNALLTIGCVSGILAGFYWYYNNWHPFSPYLISGNLFWLAIAAAIINIFPSAGLGRSLHTGRFLFHHYFYGFTVLVCAVVYIVFFTPISLLTIFLVNDTSIQVNVGRFFILGGLTQGWTRRQICFCGSIGNGDSFSLHFRCCYSFSLRDSRIRYCRQSIVNRYPLYHKHNLLYFREETSVAKDFRLSLTSLEYYTW
jgi:hypothetical protein